MLYAIGFTDGNEKLKGACDRVLLCISHSLIEYKWVILLLMKWFLFAGHILLCFEEWPHCTAIMEQQVKGLHINIK